MIDVEINSGIALLRMRHGKVNAMDLEFCRALVQELGNQEASGSRAVILTGNDRVFSAGVDLVRVVKEEPGYLDEFLPALTECFNVIFRFPRPIVAAVNGHAIAGGCILATACDYRLAHNKARIGVPELRVGVPLPSIAIEIMRFAVARDALQAMVNVGQSYRNEEALRVGLVDQIVDHEQLMEAANKAVNELLAIPAAAFAISKQQLRAPAIRNVELNESRIESTVRSLWQSEEIRDVIKKYVSERL